MPEELFDSTLFSVPKNLTVEILRSISDDEILDFLWHYMLGLTQESGCGRLDGPSEREVLSAVPAGLRASYVLTILDGEIYNGGFAQWFANSGGVLSFETIEALVLIGAERHTELCLQAIRVCEQSVKNPECRLWELPELEEADDAYYQIQRAESFWPRFVRFIREHPEACIYHFLP